MNVNRPPLTDEQKGRIRQFIDALRSGLFAQGKQRLRTADDYCCLGVACQTYKDQTGKGAWVESHEVRGGRPVYDFHTPTDVMARAVMPAEVFTWFGFLSANPLLNYHVPDNHRGTNQIDNCGIHDATALNDLHSCTFAEIADAFEQTFLKEK